MLALHTNSAEVQTKHLEKNKPEGGPGKKKSAVISRCCCETGGTSSPRSTSYLLTQPRGQP